MFPRLLTMGNFLEKMKNPLWVRNLITAIRATQSVIELVIELTDDVDGIDGKEGQGRKEGERQSVQRVRRQKN